GLIGALALAGAHHAVAGVVVDQAEGDLVERRLDGRDLREDVDAVALVLDHSLDPADLALDPAKAVEQLVLGGGVAGRGHASYPLGVALRRQKPVLATL